MILKSIILSLLCVIVWITPVWAESLSDRIAQYPNWQAQPTVKTQFEEVNYPTWMSGTWHCSSTLIDLVAPLESQNITTPGYEGNRKYLNQPVVFDVKFGASNVNPQAGFGLANLRNLTQRSQDQVVVDRVFNGLSIAKAYLGEGVVRSVQINPKAPREQLTTLQDGRELLSITTGHNSEQPAADQFITTEVFQQIFRGNASPYLNQVETTTRYELKREETLEIIADQYTAIYLSPQDPNYFSAGNTPVAIYRYKLRLSPV